MRSTALGLLGLISLVKGCVGGYLDSWIEYTANVTGTYTIQEECIPSHTAASGDVPFRGVVMMMHGFTACPQQFVDFLPLLSEAGFDILLPLLPGHGGQPTLVNGKLEDNLTYLPRDVPPYQDFALLMNSIMEEAPGEKVILGLSLGGTTAAFAASLPSLADPTKHIYDRQLIAVPLLSLPNTAFDMALDVANSLPVLASTRIGWGDGCEVERSYGRAGICQFEVSQSAAAKDFGLATLQNMTTPLPGLKTQLMFDWNDPAVSVEKIQDLYIKYGDPVSGKSVCTTPADGVHSFLSPYDNPLENKYWLNEFTCRLVSYITQTDVNYGVDLDENGYLLHSSEVELEPTFENWTRCDAVCTINTCIYNWTNTTFSMSQSCPFYNPASVNTADTSSSDNSIDLSTCEVSWLVTAGVVLLVTIFLVIFKTRRPAKDELDSSVAMRTTSTTVRNPVV